MEFKNFAKALGSDLFAEILCLFLAVTLSAVGGGLFRSALCSAESRQLCVLYSSCTHIFAFGRLRNENEENPAHCFLFRPRCAQLRSGIFAEIPRCGRHR